MARIQKKRLRLEQQLKTLAQNEGVRRINLYKFVGPDLCELWEITERDSPEVMAVKVSRQLSKLIARLPRELDRAVAEACFNLPDDPRLNELLLVARQDKVAAECERTRRTIFNRLHGRIIPELAQMMLTTAPGPDHG